VDGAGGVTSRLFFCEGTVVGNLGVVLDDGRVGLCGVGLLACGLPEPNTRPDSRDEAVS
jgi:hypothetical protein